MRRAALTACLALALVLAGCAEKAPPSAAPEQVDDAVLTAFLEGPVAAWNARDLSAAVACFAPDAQWIHLRDGAVVVSGNAQLTVWLDAIFARSPELDVSVQDAVRVGKYIVTREKTTGFGEKAPYLGLSIYEWEDGLIHRMWFADIPPSSVASGLTRAETDARNLALSQVAAFNDGKLDRYLSFFADGATVEILPGGPAIEPKKSEGKAVLARVFAAPPNLSAHVTDALVVGDLVVFCETVGGVLDLPSTDVIAIHAVRGDAIERTWLIVEAKTLADLF